MAKTGANVALLDLDAERQAGTKAECEKVGVKAFSYACDVTDVDVSRKVLDDITKDLGPVEYGESLEKKKKEIFNELAGSNN